MTTTRTITCDTSACPSRIVLEHAGQDVSDDAVRWALAQLGWWVTRHEVDPGKDRHRCPGCGG